MWNPFKKKRTSKEELTDASRKKLVSMEKEVEQLRMMMLQMQDKVSAIDYKIFTSQIIWVVGSQHSWSTLYSHNSS